jgi:polyisoprenoid-binding protein YceI
VRYRVAAGALKVQARSRIHNTTTVWSKITGEVDADPETLVTAGATARFEVDMTAFDAGDFLKNRKLRNDFELARHPTARFELVRLRDVVRDRTGFTATAEGVLDWRGIKRELVLAGRGTLDATGMSATASFELDIRTLGLSPPKFLMFKVEDEVSVEVTIHWQVVP